jgi:Protein of unknown function (DUF3303)
MLFMVIERFRNRDPEPIYRRFRDQGRMMPEGLNYVGSWIETNFDRCFQLMECDDENLFHDWMANWNDLMDFEIVPVTTSAEMQKMLFPQV